MTVIQYQGGELELARGAHHWKRYIESVIRSSIGEDVLEVGAGIGSATKVLCSAAQKKWTCLEPDPACFEELVVQHQNAELPQQCVCIQGIVQDLSEATFFDTIIYIDVLEHIKYDHEELVVAASHLRPGGKIIILSPAHQFLFSRLDSQVGHERRYSKASLKAAMPQNGRLVMLKYLDSVGIISSLANRFVLKQSLPTPMQIAAWDRLSIPLARLCDPIFGYQLGKSIVAVWQKE